MRWAQIKDSKGSRAVCFFEETVYELPAKLSPLLNFYSRSRRGAVELPTLYSPAG